MVPGLFFESLGAWEILIIGIVAVLLFGKRLPEVGRNLGKSIMSFKKGMNEMKDELAKAADADDKPQTAPEQLPSPAAPEKIVCNACAEFAQAKTVEAKTAENPAGGNA